jgi:hypothetical protein
MRFPALTPEQLAPKSTALHSGHWLIALKDYGISALQKSSPERRPRDYAARILATLNRTHDIRNNNFDCKFPSDNWPRAILLLFESKREAVTSI